MRQFRLLAVAVCFACAGPAAEAKGPNVLLICADDLAAYAVGAYGNDAIRTPNIDRLAEGGTLFRQAYCNSPVCTASRQSFLTGRYPRTIGVTQLATPLPESETTLAELLRDAGYATAALGKMHFNSDLPHGFDLRLDVPDHRRWLAGRGATPLPPGVAVQPPWRPFRDPARVWLNAACLPFAAADANMPGTWFAERGAETIQQAGGRPFFLVVSFTEPHSPFHFPLEYAGRHAAEEFSTPPVAAADDWQIPAVFRELSDAEKRGIAAAYATSVEFLDKNVGLALDALERSGQADNTLVVFLGDHGYLLGQHGRFEKHCSFEEAIRAPLIVRLPGNVAAGSDSSALVEFVDIVPTVLDLCGVECPTNVQGRSLGPLLRGEPAGHREQVVVEYAPNDEAAIRDARWKLIYERGRRRRVDGYDSGMPLPGPTLRLYDTLADPLETTNLADSPAHAAELTRLRHLLVRHLAATARQPEWIPRTGDAMELLDFLVQPRDVEVRPLSP